jgi:hypothetical protein
LGGSSFLDGYIRPFASSISYFDVYREADGAVIVVLPLTALPNHLSAIILEEFGAY